jgi:hypothetical protein
MPLRRARCNSNHSQPAEHFSNSDGTHKHAVYHGFRMFYEGVA